MEQLNKSKIAVIIPAAGQGKRMQSLNGAYPKVLTLLSGRPIISYLLDNIRRAGFGDQIILVVGHNAEIVRTGLGDNYRYVMQEQQLGTGHAVQCAESVIQKDIEHVMVLYGDQPLITDATIRKLRVLHEQEGAVITMLTTVVQDFNSWRAPLYDFGRIIRDASGKVVDIREKKDATPEELQIREVNPSLFMFKSAWLWQNLKKLQNNNVQKEYYLTDLVKIAINQGDRVFSMTIDPFECLGVNTPEQLVIAEQLIQEIR